MQKILKVSYINNKNEEKIINLPNQKYYKNGQYNYPNYMAKKIKHVEILNNPHIHQHSLEKLIFHINDQDYDNFMNDLMLNDNFWMQNSNIVDSYNLNPNNKKQPGDPCTNWTLDSKINNKITYNKIMNLLEYLSLRILDTFNTPYKTEKQLNPYELSMGFEDNQEIPIIGYGLTIESIKHWLYDHNYSTNMLKLYNVVPKTLDSSDPKDPEFEKIQDASEKLTEEQITYVETNNDTQFFIYYAINPAVEEQTVTTIDQINKSLYKIINSIYQIGQSDKVQHELQTFIKEYAGYIYTTDY